MTTAQSDIDTYLDGLKKANNLPFNPSDSDRCTILNSTASFLWPGCIFDAISLANGNANPTTMTLSRAPLTLSSTNQSVKPQTIQNPTRSSVVEAMGRMEDYSGSVQVEYKESRADSIETMDFDLNIAAHSLMSELKSTGNLTTTDAGSMVAVSINVTNFSLTMDSWSKPHSLFGDKATLADVQGAIGEDTSPCIISSLFFGKVLIIIAVTGSSASEFKAAIEATYNAAVSGGSGSVSTANKEIISSAYITSFEAGTSGVGSPSGFEGVYTMVQAFYESTGIGSIIGMEYKSLDGTPAAQPKGVKVGVSKIYVKAKKMDSSNIKLFGHCRIKLSTDIEYKEVAYQTLIDDIEDEPKKQGDYWIELEDDDWHKLPFKADGSPTYTIYSNLSKIYYTVEYWDKYAGSSNEEIDTGSSDLISYKFVPGMGGGGQVSSNHVHITVSGNNDKVETSFYTWAQAVTT